MIEGLGDVQLPDKQALLQRVRPHRLGWDDARRPRHIEPVGEGEESVWDFPRPPIVEPLAIELRVDFAGRTIARTQRGLRVLETAGAPVYHVPVDDIDAAVLRANGRISVCEWKGAATYFDLTVDGRISRDAAYAYPDPLDDLGRGYDRLASTVVFYATKVDAAFVDGERVKPQPGGYYSGWVTSRLRGPIKGEAGSEAW